MWVPRAAVHRRPVALAAAVGMLALGTASAAAGTSPLRVRLIGVRDREVRVSVWSARGSLREVHIVLRRRATLLATAYLPTATRRHRTVVLTLPRGVPARGPLTVSATATQRRPHPTVGARAYTTSNTSS